MPGSTDPLRVPIMIPSSGVNPMVVSTLLPLSIAASEQPFPRWQLTIFSAASVALQQVRCAMRAILMIDAVKSVTANAAFEPLVGSGINFCSQRQSAMESGVEDRDSALHSGNSFSASSMPCSPAALCNGAMAETSSMACFTSGVMIAGSLRCGPP